MHSFCFCFTDERLPTIDCPNSEEKTVDANDTHVVENVTVINATAAGSKHIVPDIVNPSTYTLSKDNLNNVITLTQEATDDQGFKAVCSFQYLIKRES